MNKTSNTTAISGNNSIVFFGNERLATGVTTTAPTLQALIAAGFDVKAVVSNYETGRSRNARELEIKKVAEQNNIPLLLPAKLRDIVNELKKYNAAAGVLVAYGQIVPEEVINLFPAGIINIHPSLLPKHRGPTPIESVILDGSTQTGVSLMKLVKAMDAGPVYAQSEVKLTGQETKQELADKLLEIGGSMLINLLPDILSGSVVALPQDDAQATYDKLITKDDGLIDWNKPAEQIEREIRAYTEWPKSRTTLAGKDVIVTLSEVVDASGPAGTVSTTDKELLVYCGENALKILKLKPVGKQEMSGHAFLAGYRHL